MVNKKEFATLILKYQNGIWEDRLFEIIQSLVKAIINDDDVVQDIVVIFLKKIKTIDSSQNPFSYFTQVIKNYMYGKWRKKKREITKMYELLNSQIKNDNASEIGHSHSDPINNKLGMPDFNNWHIHPKI